MVEEGEVDLAGCVLRREPGLEAGRGEGFAAAVEVGEGAEGEDEGGEVGDGEEEGVEVHFGECSVGVGGGVVVLGCGLWS